MTQKKVEDETQVTDINDILPNMFKEVPLLETLLGNDDNQKVTIMDASFETTSFGEYVILTLANGKKYRTSGKVILDQCHKIEEHLPVKANLQRKQSPLGEYLTLAG